MPGKEASLAKPPSAWSDTKMRALGDIPKMLMGLEELICLE